MAAFPSRHAIITTASTAKFTAEVNYRITGLYVSSLSSSNITITDYYSNIIFTANTLTSEGTGVYSYTTGPSVFSSPGIYKVKLTITASTGETITSTFPLKVVEGM